jgi:prepilin-type N-terminal cleavage/methylation domain-containing protein
MYLRRTTLSPRRGFTLIEASLVTAIIGIGVVAMLQLLAAGTMTNSEGTELTTGLNLAKNIRELSLGLRFADSDNPTHWGNESGETLSSYDDIDDLTGKSYSPPIDARRQALSDYTNWQQSITVQSVDPDLLTSNAPNGSTPAARVTVTIEHNGQYVCDLSWLAFDTSP